jgi:hypothetical protein
MQVARQLAQDAGDWIGSRGGYQRTSVGGTYRFNDENTLTYSNVPDSGDTLPLMPVTCRCPLPEHHGAAGFASGDLGNGYALRCKRPEPCIGNEKVVKRKG